MKKPNRRGFRSGFTLIEMLVVIAIIGILAGLLLPVLARVKTKAKIAQAQAEIRNLGAAISAYQGQYTIYPTSEDDAKAGADITYTNKNSDIIRILLDNDDAGTVNENHKRNVQKHVFLNAKSVSSAMPGVWTDTKDAAGNVVKGDYNFRDPWGMVYAITLDLDYDNKCDDKFHGRMPVPVMVWSYGPDKTPGTKDDVKNW